jgi:hypothetical protein
MEPKVTEVFTERCVSVLRCSPGKEQEKIMKKMALGLVAAAAVFTAAPAMAQVGFYAGPGGVGVGVGAPGPYYDSCGYDYSCGGGYYDYYNGPDVFIGGGGFRGGFHGHHGGGHRR